MQLIEHRTYGKGKIQKKRFGGFELFVEFEDGIRRWVRRDEVRFLSEKTILAKHKSCKSMLSKEQFKARQIIEALRLGVVPHEYVEEFTFGRKEELKQIKSWLDNINEGCLAILGEYGVGKTHLLDYIYSFALNNNWAVSMVELDPNEAPFHKPKVIYQKIVSSFRFKSINGDFREFIRKIAFSTREKDIVKYCFHEAFKVEEYNRNGNLIYCPLYKGKIREDASLCERCNYYYLNYLNKDSVTYQSARNELKEHKYLGKIIKEIRDGNDDDCLWEWIEGNPTLSYYPRMYEYSTCANVYCYILSGIGWAAKNILGMKGFLILFDEVESVDSYWYSSYQNDKAWNFLSGLILMANNDKRLLMDIDNIEHRFSWSGYSQGWWGKYTGLQYCGYNQLPFVWKIPCYVKILFAFTPIPWILDRQPLDNVNKFELEHLDNESLTKVSETILALYQRAYNHQTDANYSDLIPKDKTRLFIKGVVEALDLSRFYSNKSIERLLE